MYNEKSDESIGESEYILFFFWFGIVVREVLLLKNQNHSHQHRLDSSYVRDVANRKEVELNLLLEHRTPFPSSTPCGLPKQ